MKVILAVMHTTCQLQREVVKTRPEFFFRPYFHYFSSSVHHCEDHFQSRLNFSGHHTLSHELMSESVLTELQATPWSNYKTQSVSFLVLYDDWSTLKIVSVIISYFLNTMSNPELILIFYNWFFTRSCFQLISMYDILVFWYSETFDNFISVDSIMWGEAKLFQTFSTQRLHRDYCSHLGCSQIKLSIG